MLALRAIRGRLASALSSAIHSSQIAFMKGDEERVTFEKKRFRVYKLSRYVVNSEARISPLR